MKFLVGLVRREPVALQAFVQTVLAMLVGFGILRWNDDQIGFVLAVTAAGLGLLARSAVSSRLARPSPSSGPPSTTVDLPGAVAATGSSR